MVVRGKGRMDKAGSAPRLLKSFGTCGAKMRDFCHRPTGWFTWHVTALTCDMLLRKSIVCRPSAMRSLSSDSLNPAVHNVQYAVRGELAIKSELLRESLKKANHGLPFDRVRYASVCLSFSIRSPGHQLQHREPPAERLRPTSNHFHSSGSPFHSLHGLS